MAPLAWSARFDLSDEEERIAARLKRTGKLFVFLRRHRSRLFDDGFQAELAGMYSDAPRGTAPKPPALLAMVTLLQAYEQASDAVAVENAMFDRRWQMVLDCLACDRPPFSQGVLVDFRRRLIEHDMDRRLLERTIELAKETGDFGHKRLRIALDSAPLWGAGRVEDTFNLIGHAMEVVVECAAVVADLSAEEVRRRAGTRLLGQSSIKVALDINWDDPAEQQAALQRLLVDVEALRGWVSSQLKNESDSPPLRQALDLLAKVVEQDLEPDPGGGGARIRRGVAKDRTISVTDPEMRHGRKSRSRVINGFKRHIATDLDSHLILAASVRPANEREHAVEVEVRPDIARIGDVTELHIDRGYLAGTWPKRLFAEGKTVLSRPWRRNSPRFTKSDFTFDFEDGTVTCPAGETANIRPGRPGKPGRAAFSSPTCRACPKRLDCLPPTQDRGRTLTLHEAENLLQDLRRLRKTSEGREKLRERVRVEHALAHVAARQGPRARYRGIRKNTFDLRRTAAVENLHCLLRKEAA
jgi:hypothetical protein